MNSSTLIESCELEATSESALQQASTPTPHIRSPYASRAITTAVHGRLKQARKQARARRYIRFIAARIQHDFRCCIKSKRSGNGINHRMGDTRGDTTMQREGRAAGRKKLKRKRRRPSETRRGAIAMLRWRANAMDKRYAMLRESEMVGLM